jgi:hypothetical protein
MLRVAAAQYSVDYLTSLDQLREKLARWVAEAAAQGAKLLVFPEFSGMEIAALGDRRAGSDRRSPARHTVGPLPLLAPRRNEQTVQWETSAIQSLLPEFLSVHSDLAAPWGLHSRRQPPGTPTQGRTTQPRLFFRR